MVLVCGEEVAWGAPGEQSANGLLNTSDRFVRSEVGVEILLILKDFIESDRMVDHPFHYIDDIVHMWNVITKSI